jgi:WD40 repeat protein
MKKRNYNKIKKTHKSKKTEQPEIYALKKDKEGIVLSRKEFIGTLGAISAGVILMPFESCTSEAEKKIREKKIENINEEGISNFKAHSSIIMSVCFSPDGKMLASASYKDNVKLWSIPDGMLQKSLFHSGDVFLAIFCPDGKTLASGIGNRIKLWSIPNGELIKELEGHTDSVKSLCYSPDGKTLASGSMDGIIKLWSIPDGVLQKTLKGHQYDVSSICYSPDGKIIASGSGDNSIKLWSIPEIKQQKAIKGHSNTITSVAFCPDGKILVSASKDNTIKLWSISDGKLMKTIEGEPKEVNGINISPDGKFLAVCRGFTIELWSFPDGKLQQTLFHFGDTDSVSFSPDGKTLASGGTDGTIRLWTMPGGKPVYIFFDPEITKKTKTKIVKQMGKEIKSQSFNTSLPVGVTCICDCIASSRTYQGSAIICTCDNITIPETSSLSDRMICNCDTVTVGTDNPSSGGGSGSSTYWYPN